MGHTMPMTTSSSMKLAGLVLLGLLPHLAFAFVQPEGLGEGDIIHYMGRFRKISNGRLERRGSETWGEPNTQWKVTATRVPASCPGRTNKFVHFQRCTQNEKGEYPKASLQMAFENGNA